MKENEKKAGVLQNLSVKKKMSVLSGMLIGAMVILGIVAFVALTVLNQQTKSITGDWMSSLSKAHQMNTLTSDYRMVQYYHLNSEDEAGKKEAEEEMENLSSQITETSTAYEAGIETDEDRELLLKARELWAAYKEQSTEVLELSNSGKTKEAGVLMLGNISEVYNQFQDAFDLLVAFNEDGSQQAASLADTTYKVVVVIIVALIVLSLLLSYIMSKKVTVIITKPLEEVRSTLASIGAGDLDVSITYESKDEFGQLANEVNGFVQNLNTIISDERYLLGEMAGGNFDIKSNAEEKYVGGFQPILSSMREINTKLGNALSNIQDAGNQINGASDQLARQSQDLATGATEQAATVQELASSIEEVTGQSVASAKGAEDASSMAGDVREKVEKSNEQMQQVVDAMEIISKTSNEISTIIEAIENIASQTNLLSLNASIEAARAGEAGRGFAVVASEIGELAKECSEAASNTRNLIEKSVHQTEHGNVIVKETAVALKAVVEQADGVVKIAEAVKANSRTQEESMKEIEKGVEIISKVVETNSASAEECSATSEELNANAETLREQLAKFSFRKR